MAFSRTTAVSGVGTVSCAGTTTVTGTGTQFAFGLVALPSGSQARVGGTITVGGVTKTIVSIQSATQLTTDTAFGTFTGSAFTVQTGIIQTGTDALYNVTAAPTGFIIKEDRGGLMRIFDVQGQDLYIQGTLTVMAWCCQLRNDGSCNNVFEVDGSASGGEIIIMGRKSTAANSPFPYAGFDWLGTNGSKIMKLASTNAAYPAKFTIIDSCIRFGGDWITTPSGNYSRFTTQGAECWILCAKGTGTNQARLRQDNTTASIDFQAAKTWVNVWLNFGVPQVSLKGYTPIDTDGPEINLASVSVATRIAIEDYNTTYVIPNYYAGAQIVLLGGAWTRLKNNQLGTNIVWRSSSASGRNVLEFSKQITIKAQDTAGNLLSDGYMYYQPVGANVAGIRAKGGTVDITFDLSQQAVATSGGSATSEFVYAWDYANSNANENAYEYFCTGTTKGAETHTVYSSRYGYDKQSTTVLLAGNSAATPIFVHTSLPTTDKVIANAAAITGVTFNFTTKVMTVTGTLTIQQIYDSYQYQLNQTANLQKPDECTVSNGQTYYVGWTINNSGTINAGTNLTRIKADTVTNSGTITAIYSTSAGTSTIWRFQDIENGSSIIVYDASYNTKLFVANTNTTNYEMYIAPGTTGIYTYVVEKYGSKRQEGTFPAGLGGVIFYASDYKEDTGITEPSASVVSAYTKILTPSRLYDIVAVYRLSEIGIKEGQIATREGSYLNFGVYSGVFNHNPTSGALFTIALGGICEVKTDSFVEDSKYNKIIATPPATWTAHSNEIIDIKIEDANGDSTATVAGSTGDLIDVWKCVNGTINADFATGTKIASDIGNGDFRFIHVDGFKLIFHDKNTNLTRDCSMSKGDYTIGYYVYNSPQGGMTDEQDGILKSISTRTDIINNNTETIITDIGTLSTDVSNIPTDVWSYTTRTLTSAGSSGATLAEIEGSLILAKADKVQEVQDTLLIINDNVVNLPTLTQIEGSEIIAKESSVQDSITLAGQIPFNVWNDPSLTHDVNIDLPSISNAIWSFEDRTLTSGNLTVAEIEASTIIAKEATVQSIKTKVDTLENTDLSLVALESTSQAIKTKVDTLNNADLSLVALEATSQAIKTKVDTLENTDLTATNAKIDSKPTLIEIEASTVIAKETTLNKIIKLAKAILGLTV